MNLFPRFQLKLKGKFFSALSGLVIIMVTLASITVFFFQKQMLEKQAEDKALRLTRSLAYISLNAVLLDDYITLQILIDSMSDADDVLSIVILDTNGVVLASNYVEMRGAKFKDPLSPDIYKIQRLVLHKLKSESNKEVWNTAVPIFHLDKKIGTAIIKYSVEDAYAGLLETVIALGGIAIIISLIVSYQLTQSIVKPIKQVVNLTDEYGRGNLDASIKLDRTDEIGHLVRTLNLLSQKLKALIEEKIANENLIMIGEFGAYIIHDLKNPLSGIHLLSDGLYRKLPEDNPMKKYAYEILLASQKLEEFTKRTLDISKPSKLKLEKINLHELIVETMDSINFNSIKVEKDLDDNIPEINGDRQLLSMALKNLLTNATEAINGEGIIRIETVRRKNVIIKISDTGSGIPEDRISSIFRPFFSMKNTGHGLGLAMVKKAIIAHQGKIKVESEVGVGSMFTINLPLSL
jgi:signal transduction histidine kinase